MIDLMCGLEHADIFWGLVGSELDITKPPPASDSL